MTAKKTWIILAAFLALATGCINRGFSQGLNQGPTLYGSGNVVSQERPAQDFDVVVFEGAGNLRIHPGRDFRVVVTTDENFQEIVEARVEDGALIHGFSEGRYQVRMGEYSFDVYMPALRGIELRGAGNVAVEGGSAESLWVTVSGAGNVSAENFEARNVEVNISGNGRISVHASDLLVGSISGVGEIRLYGGGRNGVLVSGVGRVTSR
ncbi:MAG: DUF2807 domain-containing protein [Treponema sp.]|nr:DUF2807 domain-containing protein [Treponema sp.]